MLHKTRGIVFKYFKYRDTSIIVKIFTEEFGLQSYIVNGVRSSKSKGRIALYQPLTLLDLVVYHKPNSGINRISEIKCSIPLQTIPYQIVKSSIGVFIAEVLYKSIKEEGEVRDLFEFIHNSIEMLDHAQEYFQNFHLQFLLKLTRYLGFGLSESDQFFHTVADENMELTISTLLDNPFLAEVTLSNTERRILLDHILSFYKSQIETIVEIKSVNVLKTVFEEYN